MAFSDIQFVNFVYTNLRWLAVGAPRNEQCIAQLHKAIAFNLYLEAFSAKGWSPRGRREKKALLPVKQQSTFKCYMTLATSPHTNGY